MENVNYELYHHGVKGMRWGVRRKRSMSEDAKRTATIKKKKIHEMSNNELRDANNRLQLESQYKQLTKKRNVVKSAVTGFIKTAGTISAVVAAAKTYEKFGGKILDKIGNWVIKDIKF